MKLPAILSILIIIFTTGIGTASEADYGIFQSGESHSLPLESQGLFTEGWNEDLPYVAGATYAWECYAFPFSPGSRYSLSRIEFTGGGIAGPARIEIRSDSGAGFPDGEILGSGSFSMVTEVGWQGADLDSPVAIVEGVDYFIIYETVLDSYAALADPDDAPPGSTFETIPHYFSSNCVNWEGPYTVLLWMAKFYADENVAASVVSWGAAKARYR